MYVKYDVYLMTTDDEKYLKLSRMPCFVELKKRTSLS